MRKHSRWTFIAAIAAITAVLTVSVAVAAPGDLDSSFGSGGKTTINFGGTDRAAHVAVTPDGRIVTIGSTDATDPHGDFAITRLTAGGAPDNSFSGDGKTALDTGGSAADIGAGVVVQDNEQIVVSGSNGQNFVTKRLNADGGPDGGFAGGTGTSTVDFGGVDVEDTMIRQPDGKLVLVGTTGAGGGNFAIARLNENGTPDNTFSGDGKQTVDLGGADEAVSVAVTPDNKLIVAGTNNSDFAVTRLTSGGDIDPSFSGDGKQTVDFGGTDVGNGVVVEPDGSIVVAGTTSANGGDYAIAKLTSAGELDPSFDGDGKTTIDYGTTGENGLAIALEQNGKLVIVGNANPDHDDMVERLLPNGSPDPSFGSGGEVAVDFGAYEYDGDVALQPDGQIVIAGSTNVNDGGDIAVARLAGDPVSTGGGSPGGGGPPGGGNPPPPAAGPTASIQPGGTSLKLRGALRLTSFGSAPTPGARIVNFHWSLTLDRFKTDGDCGPSPVFAAPLRKPGNYNVRLTVLDSLGRTATTQRFVPVTRLGAKPSGGKGTFDCENPAKGQQPDRADCVKTFGFYIVEVNSRGSSDTCFELKTADVNGKTYHRGIVKGPVAINGLYVPVPKDVKTIYKDTDNSIAIDGAEKVGIRIGSFLTKDIDLNYKIAANKFLIYHLVDVDKSVTTPKILGKLPIRGAFKIDLGYHKSLVTVGLGLPQPLSFGGNRTAQGDVRLVSDNVNGLRYDGIKLKVPDVWIGPIFVQSLGFDYQKSTNSWGGTAKVTLPGSRIALNASGPPEQPPDFGFGIKNGKFDHAGFGIDFSPPTQPDLFPPFHTALLSHIGAALGINPLRLTGTIGISAANLVDEDGALFAVFANSRNQYTLPEDVGSELAPLAQRTFDRFSMAIGGTAKLKVPVLGALPLLNAYGLYEYPDYFEFGGGFNFGISFLSITGNVGGFAYPTNRKFNVEGKLQGCLRNIKIGWKFAKVTVSPCLTVGAVVSSKGVGFCGVVPIPFPFSGTIPVNVGAGYNWGERTPDVMIFSCDYGPYRETSPLARKAQAGGAYTVTLPKGLPAAMIRLHGQGGEPDVSVTGPDGKDAFAGPDAMTVSGTDGQTTILALRKPAGGRWTITPKDGSPAIASAETADGLAPLGLKTSVTGNGRNRVLHYRMNDGGGRTVTFLERGRGASKTIGVAHGSKGEIKFTSAPGSAGPRTIVASVAQPNGLARNVKTAKYSAPKPRPIARPRRVQARRHGGRITVSWTRVAGATGYEVLVRTADGRQVFRVVRRTRLTIADPLPSRRATVTVDALARDASRGATRATQLKAKRPARRHKRR